MKVSSSITNNEWLKSATSKLSKQGIAYARLDALIMLEDCLRVDRAKLLSHPDELIKNAQLLKLNSYLSKRLKYEPMAYIRGRVEFYGRDFLVDRSVLIPRPETESIIDILKSLDLSNGSRLLDIGCGSGCIGITAKLELPKLSVDLSDYSTKALVVAKKNAEILRANVELTKSDLLDQINESYDVITANMPYMSKQYEFDKSTAFEPRLALIGGDNGLEIYSKLWDEIQTLNKKPDWIIVESLNFQHLNMEELASETGYYLSDNSGLVQLFKN